MSQFGERSAATIFALSSGAPPAGIAIIRISGPRAGAALEAIAGPLNKARTAKFRKFRHPASGEELDHGIALWFPGPASATGEDLAELHCHGGRAVVQVVLQALGAIDGLVPAEAGEFTRRAFLNGRIDLSEAEGLADLLAAETESQRRAALHMSEGHFSRKVADWQERLLAVSAMTEAALDFSDEDDVPDAGIEKLIAERLRQLSEDIAKERQRPQAERLREGIRLVIAGPPNAGKSTLLNALVGRDAAIVSDIAGTTRDRVEVPAAMGGIAFLFTDTAGLREDSQDAIEKIGMERARLAMESADIVLWLGAAEECPDGAIQIIAKSDCRASGDVQEDTSAVIVSAKTGAGMDELTRRLIKIAEGLIPGEGEYALGERQRLAVQDLQLVVEDAAREQDQLIVAEHLRHARQIVDRLTGRAGTEEMLDRLFNGFCIGK